MVRRILDAASQVLKERGYEGASTIRIAAAAGISPGSLYQYFPNKDAILEAVVAEYTQQLLESVSSNLRAFLKCKPPVLVSAAVRVQIDAMLERPEILRMISGQLPGYSGADVLKPMEALIANIIRGYAIALPNPPIDIDIDAATWIIGQLLGTAIRYAVDEPPISRDAFVNEITGLVLGHPIIKAMTQG